MCPPLTGPPSAPQNLVYNINQTTVNLEWSPPADTGGRNDVTYRVICRRCSWEPEECVPCGPNVGYSPAQSGLVDTYVSITDLLAHANYTLEVEAVNGVSDLSRTQRLFAAVSIATGQAGKAVCWYCYFIWKVSLFFVFFCCLSAWKPRSLEMFPMSLCTVCCVPVRSLHFAPAERASDICTLTIDSLILKTSHTQVPVMISN